MLLSTTTSKNTTHYYNALWLAVYVFYPITWISHFYKEYSIDKIFDHIITQNVKGKCVRAPRVALFHLSFRRPCFLPFQNSCPCFLPSRRLRFHKVDSFHTSFAALLTLFIFFHCHSTLSLDSAIVTTLSRFTF